MEDNSRFCFPKVQYTQCKWKKKLSYIGFII